MLKKHSERLFYLLAFGSRVGSYFFLLIGFIGIYFYSTEKIYGNILLIKSIISLIAGIILIFISRKYILTDIRPDFPGDKYAKWIIGFVLILIVLIGCRLLFDSFDTLCVNEIEEILLSPNGELKAVLFLRNCGATEGYKPGVSVLLVEDNFDVHKEGNVFLCYRCGCTYIQWISNNELKIDYCWPEGTGFSFESPDDFLQIQETVILDVSVSYDLIEE